jgi:hypothetical protein
VKLHDASSSKVLFAWPSRPRMFSFTGLSGPEKEKECAQVSGYYHIPPSRTEKVERSKENLMYKELLEVDVKTQ